MSKFLGFPELREPHVMAPVVVKVAELIAPLHAMEVGPEIAALVKAEPITLNL